MIKYFQHPYILLILAPLVWGGNAVAGKLAAGLIEPFTFTALRWGLMLIILIPFALPSLRRDWSVIKKKYRVLFAYGIVGFSGFNMLLYTSLKYTTAINCTLIQSVIPMIIVLLSRVIFKERLCRLQITGLFLAVTGVLLIVTNSHIQKIFNLSFNKGDLMMLGGATLYALYSMTLRFKPNVSWISFIAVCGFGALLFSLPFVIYEIMTKNIVIHWSKKTIGIIAYTAIFASLIGQLAYAKGVSIIGAGRAGLAINLVPVFGSLLAIAILNESFYSYHFIALACVLGGIALSEYSVKLRKKTS